LSILAFGLPAHMEKWRVELPGYPPGDEQNGAIFWKPEGITVLFSNGLSWEHVSVSRKKRTPSWDDMHRIKELFWQPEDVVIQFHPPRSEYVNNHQHCLHLWRPMNGEIITPPSILVGIK